MDWPKTLFTFMSRYQFDLDQMRKDCRERFGSTQSGNCTHCGKHIQQNLGKHIALYHMELTQLWRCPVTWCTVWKGTVQDCVNHIRQAHDILPVVKAANLARWFPPWTVTREQWTSMTRPAISGVAVDTLLFSRIGYSCSTAIGSSIVRELMGLSGAHTCDVCMLFWRIQMRRRYVGAIAGALRTLRHRCRGHRFGTDVSLGPKSLVGQSPGPGGLTGR